MKNLIILCISLLSISLFAQVPQGIKYQVVVRDAYGIPIENQSISLRISLLEDSATGAAAYVETHTTTTNALGLVNLNIGQGSVVSGSFAALDWHSHEYHAKVEVDTAGGSTYALLGISQLLTVPYAFHAGSSGNIVVTMAQRDAIANPFIGMQVFNTDDDCFNVYNGTKWINPCGFRCGDLLVDKRDQQQYPTVQIGTQCWMAKNLNVGVMVTDDYTGAEHTHFSDNSIIEKYCYNNDSANCSIYGGLYDWNEMMGYVTTEGIQGICPTGWHIPTDAQWTVLENFLGGSSVAGGKMKETGTTHWNSPNTGATNSSGFTALGAGYRGYTGFFHNLWYYAFFWSSSEYSSTLGIYRYLYYDYALVSRDSYAKTSGFSVRCLRD